MKKFIDGIIFRLALQSQYSNIYGWSSVIVSLCIIGTFLFYYSGTVPVDFTTAIYWAFCPIIGLTLLSLLDSYFIVVSVPHALEKQYTSVLPFDEHPDLDSILWLVAGGIQVVGSFILFLQYEPIWASILLTTGICAIPILLYFLIVEKIQELGEAYKPLSKKAYA